MKRTSEEWASIKAEAEAAGWSHADVARRLGVPRGTVSAAFARAGKRDPVQASSAGKRSPESTRERRAEQIAGDLTDTQAAVLWRVLDGQSERRIARDLDIDRATVSAWKRDPIFASHLSAIRIDRDLSAQESAVAGKVEAIEADREVLQGLLDDFRAASDADVRAKLAGPIRSIAADVMDRGGLPKTEKIEHSGEIHTTGASNLTDAELDAEIATAEYALFEVIPGGR